MTERKDIVFVVDDDDAVRDSLCFLLKTIGITGQGFGSGDEFLENFDPDTSGCILLDIGMPGISGMEVQRRLVERDCRMPIIFITGHGDIPMAVEAMHLGAFDFIQKPFHDQELLDRVQQALSVYHEAENERARQDAVQALYNILTPREKEVMGAVVLGHANKVIAMDLELSQRTVEIHRARVMEKMQARSLADLVKRSILIET
jgi:two-component system response regulator FixJ